MLVLLAYRQMACGMHQEKPMTLLVEKFHGSLLSSDVFMV